MCKLYSNRKATYIFIFVFVVMVGSSLQCPQGCTCIDQVNAVPTTYCHGHNIYSVPKQLSKNTEMLSFFGTSIRRLSDNDFNGMNKLEELKLHYNSIQYISPNAFQNLKSLKLLNLGHNNLLRFPVESLRHLSSLEELFLNDNLLEELPNNLFNILPNLRRLHLYKNKIVLKETNKVFSSLDNLVYLDLSYNKIRCISRQYFENLRKLKWLYLNDNEIKKVSNDAFESLVDLKELTLSNNKITTLDENTFSENRNLESISFYKNPWNCDCRLIRLFGNFRKGMRFPKLNVTKCHAPVSLVDKHLHRLEIDDADCYGVWEEWSQWTACDKSCNRGKQARYRSCNSNARSNVFGICKGSNVELQDCNLGSCLSPKDFLTEWSEWTVCRSACEGVSTRERKCIDSYTQKEIDSCEEELKQSRSCQTKICPIDGGWSEWSPWSPCDKRCIFGMKRRIRTCSNPYPQSGGKICQGGHTQTQNKICIQTPCPSQTSWGQWSQYSECTTKCGIGKICNICHTSFTI